MSDTDPPNGRDIPASHKLIFYSNISPVRTHRAWTAFWFAEHALAEGLDVEIFLAGPGTSIMRHDVLAAADDWSQGMVAKLAPLVPISLAPG